MDSIDQKNKIGGVCFCGGAILLKNIFFALNYFLVFLDILEY